MYFRSRSITIATTRTTAIPREIATTTTIKMRTTTTNTLRGTAAIWLFLLTFMSMQRHRLSGDCCYGAALLMEHQIPQKQQQQIVQQQHHQIPQHHSQQQYHHHQSSSSLFRANKDKRRETINSDASTTSLLTSTTTPMSLSESTSTSRTKSLPASKSTSLPSPKSTSLPPSTTTSTSMKLGKSQPIEGAIDEVKNGLIDDTDKERWSEVATPEEDPEEDEMDPDVAIRRIPRNPTDSRLQADDPETPTSSFVSDDPDTSSFVNDDPVHSLARLLQEQSRTRPRVGEGENYSEVPSEPTGRRHVMREKLQFTSELSIKQGRIVGIVRRMQPQTGLRDVDQFLGLPYAEAPVGSRRFMPPGTPLPWQGLKMARHLPPVCPQKLPDAMGQKMSRGRYKQLSRLLPYLRTESEDCLYLNVYVPRGDGLDQSHLYPVLVYIHGESFEWNSGNPYDGSVLASYGEVIVVTVNYRLGVLGFMKPGIGENTVANFGLLDQIAALHWIKENIGFFGGDRDSVTLMGHSTGAACVNYLMVSPVASGLFHRAILMSGSAMSDWAAANHSLQLTMQLAHSLDCPLNDDNEEMLDCLRAKRYEDILKISTAFPQFSTSLGPIVDGHVIPNQPYKVMGQYTELFSRYDLLFGVTESESYHTLDAPDLEEGLREDERDNLLRFYMQSRFDIRPDLALAATMKKYIDMYNNPIRATNTEHRDVVLDILSDARVVGPLMQTGLFHADVNPHNYMYVFGHNSVAGPHASLPHSIVGEELAFIFGAPLAPSGPFHNSYTKHEKLLSEAVMAYWSNFAKTGNPKAPWKGTFINLHAMEWDRYDLDWPEFNKRTQAYINIGIPPSIGYKYRQIYMNFWNKELPDELNQIAAIQQQPFLHAYPPPRGGTSPSQPPPRRVGEVITGHMSQYGSRDNAAEDPLRRLKLLMQEPYGNVATPTETAENMYNAPPTFGIARQPHEDETQTPTSKASNVWGVVSSGRGSDGDSGSTSTSLATRANEGETKADPEGGSEEKEVARSETTMQLLIGLIVVFIVLNVVIYSTFLLQKKKKKQSATTTTTSAASQMIRKLGAGGHGGILSYDGTTDDELKRSKPIGDGDDSFILDIVRKSNTYEAVKTTTTTTTCAADRSPINGFQMKRQLSCSTVDTHTKVCEWMAGGGGLATATRATPKDSSSGKSSKKTATTMSSSSFSSPRGSSAGSFLQRPHQVSVAVDATPQARGQSVLCQEPIEVTRLTKGGGGGGGGGGQQIIICQEVEVVDQELLTPQDSLDSADPYHDHYNDYRHQLIRQHSAATEACDSEFPPQQGQHESEKPLVISHSHSRSDPVHQRHANDEQITSFIDVNVTSRSDDDEFGASPLTPAEQLSLIKRRNYPKVLPTDGGVAGRSTDSPPMTLDLGSTRYKRNSLPPNGFVQQLLQLGGVVGRNQLQSPSSPTSSQLTQPPLPPPRTISTLGRRPSLGGGGGRRGSGALTTSPVRLAHDCTVDEEEEPGPIAQNTLIVGPIVPKADYSTLRRQRKGDGGACPGQGACQSTSAHHTEAVYSIEAPAPTSIGPAPLTPITPTTPLSPANFSTAPNMPTAHCHAPTCNDIYAVPNKAAARANAMGGGKSNIPRMLPLGQDGTTATTTMGAATTITAAVTTEATTIISGSTAGHDMPTTMTGSTSSTSGVSSSSSTAATASRIPQLNRSLNTFQQQQQQQQQQNQQQHNHLTQQHDHLHHQQHDHLHQLHQYNPTNKDKYGAASAVDALERARIGATTMAPTGTRTTTGISTSIPTSTRTTTATTPTGPATPASPTTSAASTTASAISTTLTTTPMTATATTTTASPATTRTTPATTTSSPATSAPTTSSAAVPPGPSIAGHSTAMEGCSSSSQDPSSRSASLDSGSSSTSSSLRDSASSSSSSSTGTVRTELKQRK